jgi:hypothetical protein
MGLGRRRQAGRIAAWAARQRQGGGLTPKHMISWLHHRSDFWVLFILMVPFVQLVLAASLLHFRLRPRLAREDPDFNMMDTFVALGSAAAVILAFSLVQVDATFRSLQDGVSKEAAAINDLDRMLTRYGDPCLAPARESLQRYVRALISDEWPRLVEGQRSEKADALFRAVSIDLRALEPQSLRQGAMFSEGLKAIDDAGDLREARISAAREGLPPLFWRAMLGLGLLLVIVAAYTEPTRRRLLSMAAIAAALGLLLAMVVIVDAPFAGEANLQPDALERVLAQIQNRH